ncbi:unnamed protein product [Clavelina lepadiformis]|uniref:RIIa domain-containing protein n=1 Tax=Clavelina lepadiformis TaxID=159417 RepID=A0ABP0F2V4_CLALP
MAIVAMEVLRHQPEDIVQFSSHYFSKLLCERKTTCVDPCIIFQNNDEPEEKFYIPQHKSDKSIFNAGDTDLKVLDSDKQAFKRIQLPCGKHREDNEIKNNAAKTIQTRYRRYVSHRQLNKNGILGIKGEACNLAATKIQASFRGHKVRKEIIQARKIQEKSVTKIQAAYRGYKTRKSRFARKDQTISSKQDQSARKIQATYKHYRMRRKHVQKTKEHEDYIAAAVKIQSNFRGYATRKKLKVQSNNAVHG